MDVWHLQDINNKKKVTNIAAVLIGLKLSYGKSTVELAIGFERFLAEGRKKDITES